MEAGGAPLAPGPENMAALRAAKKALRLEMKRKVAALSDAERRRQTEAVSRRVSDSGETPAHRHIPPFGADPTPGGGDPATT
ncbi:hypothetical protein chiPu_0018296 [Chiloscyllium punctatum]|uniref:Uncharacterized protein n=1 Tax=Chiloscyllium punctatum TaxID=137246 RepID=A0A401RM91_CHIPU|nr:hypothetical protein [Chiloscyllium punctatum]